MSSVSSVDREYPVEDEHAAHTMLEDEGAVMLGDRNDLHIGDYVGFERVCASREWRLSLGKVVGFPTSHTVKVAHFDPVNEDTTTIDPITEQEIRHKAEEDNKMELWQDRDALREQMVKATAEEIEATKRLYTQRDATLEKQSHATDATAVALEHLDAARVRISDIPSRQWRDVRSKTDVPESIASIIRALMIMLHEDRAVSMEAMQSIMRQSDFMDRILDWDCTATPMSAARRDKILELGNFDPEVAPSKKKSTKRHRRNSASQSKTHIPDAGVNVGALAVLDESIRAFINAQLECSVAGDAQARIIDECFKEQQQQRTALREINDMRIDVSQMQQKMLEIRKLIMGISDAPKAIQPLETQKVDTVFYKRTYPEAEGRFVQEVILRESVLINFGPLASEDADGYVRLSKGQSDELHLVVRQANIRHDADEMEELLARKEREEIEIAELKARIAELRAKSRLTPEEEEELMQLEKYLEEAERRHRATLSRIADLYACGRGAREITMATKRLGLKYSRLHCKMAGDDWAQILDDTQKREEMIAVLRSDLSTALNLPVENILDIDACCGSLLIDFTVKHSGELDDDELQDLVNNGEFAGLCMFYERVTFKKTSPINTPEQEEAYARSLKKRLPVSGMGIKEQLSDYYNADGTLDEEFSEEITSDVDYRKAEITIPPVREDYEEFVVLEPVVLCGVPDSELPEPIEEEPVKEEKTDEQNTTADGDYGLTVGDSSMPATAMQTRGIQEEDVVPVPQEAAADPWEELETPTGDRASTKKTSPKEPSVKSASKHSSPKAAVDEFDEL